MTDETRRKNVSFCLEGHLREVHEELHLDVSLTEYVYLKCACPRGGNADSFNF